MVLRGELHSRPTILRNRQYDISVYALSYIENGYILAFEPYVGKLKTEHLVLPALPFIARIVIQLAQQVLNKTEDSGCHLFTDYFYTSIPLATELHSQNIHLTKAIQKKIELVYQLK